MIGDRAPQLGSDACNHEAERAGEREICIIGGIAPEIDTLKYFYLVDHSFTQSRSMKFKQFRVFDDQSWKTVYIGPEEKLRCIKRKTFTNINDKRKILEQDQYKCRKCGREVSIARMDFDIDHIQPVKYSGPTHLDNLQVLCTGCHRQKTYHPSKWIVEKDFTGLCDSLYVFEKFENKIVGETTRRKLGYLEAGVYNIPKELGEFRPNKRRRVYDEEYMHVMIAAIDKICKAVGFSGIEDRTSELPLNLIKMSHHANIMLLLEEALGNSRERHRCNSQSIARKLNSLLQTHTKSSLVATRKRQVEKKRDYIYKIVGPPQQSL